MHTRATQTFSNVVPTSSDTNILPRGLSLLALCLWYYNGFNSVTAAAHQHKQVPKECRNTSVTSWLLVMSEAYQEEDAVVQIALHLCCCSDAESHSSLGHNNRQPLHLVVWEVIPSKAGREALRRSARAQCTMSKPHKPLQLLLLSRRACPRKLSSNKPTSRLHRARVKNAAFRYTSKYPRELTFDIAVVEKLL